MFARVAPLLLVVCLVLGPLWIATSGGADRSADYEAELARIDRAKPQPPVKPLSGEDLGNPKKVKKVKAPSGAVYYIPRHRKPIKRTATAAVDGCGRRTYRHSTHGGTFSVPHPPGVTAKLIRDGLTVLVTYRIGEADVECQPTSLSLTADVSDDFLGGDGLDYRIEDEAGQVELPLQGHVANADVLLANTWTPANGGLSSDNTTIRIRGALAPEPTITVPTPPIPDPGRLPGAPPLGR
jgi:hypothetical protein